MPPPRASCPHQNLRVVRTIMHPAPLRGSRMRRVAFPCLFRLLMTLWVSIGAAVDPVSAQDVTGPQVARAIQNGIQFLRGAQRVDGSWPDYGLEGGASALS